MRNKVFDKLSEEDQAKYQFAMSMKLINNLYDKLMQRVAIMIHEGDDDVLGQPQQYELGWNNACESFIQLMHSMKYTIEDLDGYVKEYMDGEKEGTDSDIPLS